MVEDDTTKMNVSWKSGSKVYRARELSSVSETDLRRKCLVEEMSFELGVKL